MRCRLNEKPVRFQGWFRDFLESHPPTWKALFLSRTLDQQHDSLMAVVCLDACEERIDLFVIPFQDWKIVAVAKKQKAFNVLAWIKVSCFCPQICEFRVPHPVARAA